MAQFKGEEHGVALVPAMRLKGFFFFLGHVSQIHSKSTFPPKKLYYHCTCFAYNTESPVVLEIFAADNEIPFIFTLYTLKVHRKPAPMQTVTCRTPSREVMLL